MSVTVTAVGGSYLLTSTGYRECRLKRVMLDMRMKKQSKTESIYDSLRSDIVLLNYDVNEPINEKMVAEKYGVSKTPAREALNMLVQDGYLRKYPRLGYFVNEVTETEYYKLLYLRFILEKGVLTHIISNCSNEEIDGLYAYCTDTDVSHHKYAAVNMGFHFAMAEITENEYLIAAVKNTFERMIRVPSKQRYMRFLQEPHAKHKLLIEALKARDTEAAFQLLREECRREDDIEIWF